MRCGVGVRRRYPFASTAFAQLDAVFQAHGGLAKWQGYGTVQFDQTWTSAKAVKKDHQLFDLHSREGLITSDAYSLGSSRGEVWVKPGLEVLGGTPPALLHVDAVLLFRDAVCLRRSGDGATARASCAPTFN